MKVDLDSMESSLILSAIAVWLQSLKENPVTIKQRASSSDFDVRIEVMIEAGARLHAKIKGLAE